MNSSSSLNDNSSDALAERPRSAASDLDESNVSDFRQYRAPREHGESFVEPSFDQAPEVLRENQRLLSSQDAFESMRRGAREKLVEDALRYTSAYRSIDWLDGATAESLATKPILMAGHQPALFHAGVWFKNFALSHIANQADALAVNLVIDNDVASGSSIRVPTIDPIFKEARYESVAYDEAGGGVPYEQTTIRDRDKFDHFDQEVKRVVSPLINDPCVTPLWEHARSAIERCGIAGCALAQARHGLEGEIGLNSLEVPLGVVCRTTEFAEFVLSILTELPRFHRCYNDAANQYRRTHGIRSSAHPVPNLAEDQGWFEAPLWIYGNDSPVRQPAWARLSDDHLIISDRKGREIQVDVRFPKLAAEQLSGLVSPNFKMRPRALLTTMYGRLILSDLFIHGIGGAKYDQLGDMIIRSYFMVTPPRFMVISATVKLPGTTTQDHPHQIRRLKRQLRETRYQPERFADQIQMDPQLLERKRNLLESCPPRGSRKQWHDELTEVNESLSQS
ncbi:MAG: hypothetical protein ACR2NZ_12140, partial [Rubripirellula sp.]